MKFEDQTFQSILTDPTTGKNGLVVPEYQRHYAWDAKATRQFLDDLKDETQSRTNSTEDDEQPHVGAIILHQDRKTGEINVVDGQQRLTTLTLLVAMLRRECQHYAVNSSDASLREKFQEVAGQCKALLFVDEDDCEEIRLKLLDEDQPHLSSLLTGKALTEGDLPRSKLPAVAAAFSS